MEFVISPTLCQLRYSFQTWILQFHLSRGSDSNRDCFRIREVSSNLLDDLSIFSKITFNSAFMIFSRLTLQAISTTIVESSGKWGPRTPLLQGQYDDLWTGLIYSQVSLTSQISKNLLVGAVWFEQTMFTLRDRIYSPALHHRRSCTPNYISNNLKFVVPTRFELVTGFRLPHWLKVSCAANCAMGPCQYVCLICFHFIKILCYKYMNYFSNPKIFFNFLVFVLPERFERSIKVS